MAAVVSTHIPTPHGLHEQTQGAVLLGREQQMKVIGGQAVGVDADPMGARRFALRVQQQGTIDIVARQGLTVVDALHDQMRPCRHAQSGQSGHDDDPCVVMCADYGTRAPS